MPIMVKYWCIIINYPAATIIESGILLKLLNFLRRGYILNWKAPRLVTSPHKIFYYKKAHHQNEVEKIKKE